MGRTAGFRRPRRRRLIAWLIAGLVIGLLTGFVAGLTRPRPGMDDR